MKEPHPSIFRAYDIRGKYQKDINQHSYYSIGQAVGTYIQQHIKGDTLTVGNDIRKTSESLSYAFISGVTSTGVDVINVGTSSFGQTLFHGWNHKHDLISFITASHLPAEWNGVKFYYGDGIGLPEEELMKIRDITLQKTWAKSTWKNIGHVTIADPTFEYIDFFTSRFTFDKKIKVAVDCGGGSMTLSVPDVFHAVGIDIVPVYCEPDPLFSVRPSDPKPAHLTTLVQRVQDEQCDFGVAFDGDGDRAVIVDNKGVILTAEQTGIIIGKYGIDQKKGTIIVNVECSKSVEEQLTPLGFSVKQIQVGHTYLTLHAKKEQAPLGIESSGHLIIPSYFLFDDALIIPLKIAEILTTQSDQLSDLLSTIPMYPQKKVEIPCDDATKFDVISYFKTKYELEYTDVNTLDGIRIELDTGWVLIRASNTSPLIRLTIEAETMPQIKQIQDTFESEIKAHIKKL